MPGAAEALYKPRIFQNCPECLTGILASSVTVKDGYFELLAVLQFKFLNGSDTKLFLHIAIHSNRKDLAVVTIENCRKIQLSVIALYLCDVRKQLIQRLF